MKFGNRSSLLLLIIVGCLLSCTSTKEIAGPVQHLGSDASVPGAPPASPLMKKDLARRDEIEAMMLRGEYLHDGASELSSVGDIGSVPALLVVLKKHPPGKNGVMVCTTAHALSALRDLTGADPGHTYEAWSAWWKVYQRQNPGSGRLEKTVDVTPH